LREQANGGRVINVASDLGYFGREDFSAYCASKAGVLSLTRSWAKEFGPDILVNAIAPGPIDTDMLSLEAMSAEWREKEEQIPLERVGQPEEVASVAVFLAGPGASFMTGQVIDPNGGSVMP
jgi:3-oxoacyl-[acyl-carrier protein] reductase